MSTRAPKPSRVDMSKVTGYYTELHRREEPNPPGILVPTYVKQIGVNNGFPLKGE